MFSRNMVFPYASVFILALGGGSEQIGFVNSFRPLAGLLIYPISGYLTDIKNRVKLISLQRFLAALCFLLFIFAPSWQWIALGTLLYGFMVFHFPPTSAIIAESLEPKKRGVGIATMNTISITLSMFSPYIAGITLDVYGDELGMRLLYGVLSIAYIIIAIINLRFLRDTGERGDVRFNTKEIPKIIREAYTGLPSLLQKLPATVRGIASIIILGFTANAMVSPFWVIYAIEHIGLTYIEWGTILLLETALQTILYIPAGILVDRYGRTRTLTAALTLSMFSIPLFIYSKGFYETLAIRSLIAITNALFIPACTALIADTVPRDIRGRVMAAMGRGDLQIGAPGEASGGPGIGFLVTLPLIMASIIGGFIYAINHTYPWIFAFFTIIISLIISALYIRDPIEAER
jgi:MFS family permease